VLKIIEETDYAHYLIMFRGNLGRSDFRALYGHDGGQSTGGMISGSVLKLHGPSNIPEVLEDKMIEKFFRYESGTKAFSEITGIKGFTLTTDAVTLSKNYSQVNKKNALNNILY
jgi:calmodulin-regulated spectrin-associated protein